MIQLQNYGWDDSRHEYIETTFPDTTLSPARVVADFGTLFTLVTPARISAQLAGTALHSMATTEMPKVGDWVMVDSSNPEQPVIQAVLPRRNELVRGQVGRLVDKQVVAANIDIAFIVQPLGHDFSIARLERYIFQLSAQSITPIIVLNKADTAKNLAGYLDQLADIGVDVITMSALHDTNISSVERYLTPGKTAVILGSSGAGKSTLTNRLLGENRQQTQQVRDRDAKGRHTTVHRELFMLPSGGMIIDTPGIRELQLWGTVDELKATFPEIAQAAADCHYPQCSHVSETNCGIKNGLTSGSISQKRYKIYCNFLEELETLETRRNFIDERRSQQSHESAKRLRLRQQRDAGRYDQAEDTRQ